MEIKIPELEDDRFRHEQTLKELRTALAAADKDGLCVASVKAIIDDILTVAGY